MVWPNKSKWIEFIYIIRDAFAPLTDTSRNFWSIGKFSLGVQPTEKIDKPKICLSKNR